MNTLKILALSAAAVGASVIGRRIARASRRRPVASSASGWLGCDFTEFGFGKDESDRIPQYIGIAEDAAAEFGIDPDWVLGTIHVESKFDPRALSSAGALGLMQLLPRTSAALAEDLGIPNQPSDPRSNVRMGSKYLSSLLRTWNGDKMLASASFWAGIANVRDALENGSLTEKQDGYAQSVLSASKRFSRARAQCL